MCWENPPRHWIIEPKTGTDIASDETATQAAVNAIEQHTLIYDLQLKKKKQSQLVSLSRIEGERTR